MPPVQANMFEEKRQTPKSCSRWHMPWDGLHILSVTFNPLQAMHALAQRKTGMVWKVRGRAAQDAGSQQWANTGLWTVTYPDPPQMAASCMHVSIHETEYTQCSLLPRIYLIKHCLFFFFKKKGRNRIMGAFMHSHLYNWIIKLLAYNKSLWLSICKENEK